ncbi:MAG: helix-turn-helix transcriptional regulator [Clostridia bacterium]|nr:helix-turn-helix transcriptional regulator [Clostridia bacterium]
MKDDILLKEIGVRIKNRRKEIGMTQEKLAELMDVSLQMISNLEQGKKAIRPENIIKLCSAINVSADYILRGCYSEYETTEFINCFNSLSQENKKLIETLTYKLSEKQ